ncbi:SDR family oxidoreductase [Pseudomonas nitroreducens]|uniref:SDR family oxidoreductase n=1 Tax=Pseudomonas nitroreducens TaxID=46680 RepID=UPI002657BC80|nr:SDR family oxidoreductase [Pseudomonas nitroreducens]MCP1651575.1 NAD(P)-dependent dehydrogenase (short-subunit alcohol dehydrogenase family)/pimeloyl-ACP methyl ester carboxylesterase [Pseudomonas nitroreducens]MCP1684560.1 NAD(P)-dependent dehydrogenase (short-subunit alcohol dehydrogenase family)/pimeloyl-ACP methyl ester carboxylesterase [Pseudomonas nitroreducens]
MNAMLEKTLPAPERLDVQSGNVRLAVWHWGEAHLPMVLFVHGYPDNHETWLPLIRHLSGRFQLVAYDVRGAGESDKPRKTRDYRLELLSQDLKAVLDAVSPQRAVHLVAHDWGSIQTWESVTDPQLRARIASYTSVSGPCLDHVGFWMRDRLRRKTPRALLQMASQLLHSWYIYYFHLPLLPSLSWRFGAAKAWPQYLRKVEGIRNPVRNPHQASDGEHGVKLYRANFITSIFKPRKRHTEVPVQLIVPTRDRYVGQQLFQQLSLWAPRLWRRDVTAGHWQLLAEPTRLGKWIDEFVSHIEGGEATPELQRAALKPGAGPFAGKLVVVTGAGGGIGRSTLLSFAERGASVLAADIDPAAAERSAELARAVGATAHSFCVDVGDSAAMERFAQWVKSSLGVPDVVVSNAGIGMAGPMLKTTPQEWERLLRINLWSVIDGCRLFGQQMVEAGKPGHLVNVASGVAFAPSRNYPAYATSKAAVLMLSECLRAELAGHGIGVSAACPGFVDTGIVQATRFAGLDEEQQAKHRARVQRFYRRRRLSPDTVGERITRAVERNQPVVKVGSEVHLGALQWRFMPWLSRLFARLNLTA